MAVPTIASVTPATGPAAGHEVIVIAGTNFRTRTVVLGPDPGNPASTVKVLFGGYEAKYVKAVSSTELLVLLNPCRQDPNAYPETFPAVAVRVSNLDDTGVEIPREIVTKTDAFTYQRAQIALPAPDPPLQQVVRAFLQRLKRVLWKDVAIRTHPDFSDEQLDYTIIADLPVVTVRADAERDPFGSAWDNTKEVVDRGGYWDLYRPSRTYRLTFHLTMAAKTGSPAYRMTDAIMGSFIDEPALLTPADTRWSTTANEYPIDIIAEPKCAAIIGKTGAEAFDMAVRVSGVPIMPTHPAERVYQIVNIYLAMANTELSVPLVEEAI